VQVSVENAKHLSDPERSEGSSEIRHTLGQPQSFWPVASQGRLS